MDLVKDLECLVDNSHTDKNTTHSYLPLYNSLLYPLKEKAQNVLEIGIGDFGPKNGGSIIMWNNFFPNATVYGIDTLSEDRVLDELKNNNKVVLYTSTDGYNYNFIKREFIDKNIKFDFIIDDGPHTLDSQLYASTNYFKKLKINGLLIIEDIFDFNFVNEIENHVKNTLPSDSYEFKCFDFRKSKNRFDDVIIEIKRLK